MDVNRIQILDLGIPHEGFRVEIFAVKFQPHGSGLVLQNTLRKRGCYLRDLRALRFMLACDSDWG